MKVENILAKTEIIDIDIIHEKKNVYFAKVKITYRILIAINSNLTIQPLDLELYWIMAYAGDA